MGFSNAGLKILAASDNWEAASVVYKKNFPNVNFLLEDVRSLDLEALKKLNPDIVFGGPPCQDFSPAGKRNGDGTRADLTYVFATIVSGLSPRWFVMENVPQVEKTKVYELSRSLFKKSGYGLSEAILDSSYHGVPQIRKRFFVVGKKKEIDGFMDGNLRNNQSSSRLTVREYLGERIDTQFYYRHPRTYGRRAVFSIDEPSPTIRGVNRPIPKNYRLHPGDACKDLSRVRPLTTKERALIQTFPEQFEFIGPKTDVEQMIGNAVPVKLAEFVASQIVRYESGFDALANSTSENKILSGKRKTLEDWTYSQSK